MRKIVNTNVSKPSSLSKVDLNLLCLSAFSLCSRWFDNFVMTALAHHVLVKNESRVNEQGVDWRLASLDLFSKCSVFPLLLISTLSHIRFGKVLPRASFISSLLEAEHISDAVDPLLSIDFEHYVQNQTFFLQSCVFVSPSYITISEVYRTACYQYLIKCLKRLFLVVSDGNLYWRG